MAYHYMILIKYNNFFTFKFVFNMQLEYFLCIASNTKWVVFIKILVGGYNTQIFLKNLF